MLQATAVHVQLSDRHEFVRGMPQHRTLTLTGTLEGIQCVLTLKLLIQRGQKC